MSEYLVPNFRLGANIRGSEMKERPILFNGKMVRAILDGRKTQTRRVVKPQPVALRLGLPYAKGRYSKCPYGQPGDRLWVRETFRIFDASIECGCSEYPCNCPSSGAPIYRATHDDGESHWKPSIHMPRKLCRITLEITDIRVERLQDMTASDAIAEGIEVGDFSDIRYEIENRVGLVDRFSDLWQSINGPGSWDANPWVWVVEFKRVEG